MTRRSASKDDPASSSLASFGYQQWSSYDLRGNFSRMPKLQYCAMCRQRIRSNTLGTHSPHSKQSYVSQLMGVPWVTLHYRCLSCGWWALREQGEYHEVSGGWDTVVSGAIKHWNLADHELPISFIRGLYERNKTIDLKVLDAMVFERLIAECLRYELGPCEVHHVGVRGGRGDGGIDLYLVKEEQEWLVQIKRRLTDKSEPVETIRLLNGVLLRDGKTMGMVVTSAPSFSRNAVDEAMIKTPGAYQMKLVDRGQVLEMVKRIPFKEPEPWRTALTDLAAWETTETPSEELLSLFGSFERRSRV